MRRYQEAKELSGLENIISILFIIGVAVSLSLESIGLVMYFIQNHNMEIAINSEVTITGHDFFSFIFTFARNGSGTSTSLTLITAGIIVLILTPFMRVVFSAVYFAWERNYKYVVITVFVLGVITASLALH